MEDIVEDIYMSRFIIALHTEIKDFEKLKTQRTTILNTLKTLPEEYIIVLNPDFNLNPDTRKECKLGKIDGSCISSKKTLELTEIMLKNITEGGGKKITKGGKKITEGGKKIK
jgi:hypothetical protein